MPAYSIEFEMGHKEVATTKVLESSEKNETNRDNFPTSEF